MHILSGAKSLLNEPELRSALQDFHDFMSIDSVLTPKLLNDFFQPDDLFNVHLAPAGNCRLIRELHRLQYSPVRSTTLAPSCPPAGTTARTEAAAPAPALPGPPVNTGLPGARRRPPGP